MPRQKHQWQKNTDARANFKISYLNVGGLNEDKFEKVLYELYEQKIDILAISETWKNDLPFVPPGFKVVAKKNAVKRIGNVRRSEGIIVLAREQFNCTPLLNASKHGVGIRFLETNIVFMYVHPDDTGENELVNNEFFEINNSQNNLILGDVNMCDDTGEDDKFCDTLAGYGIWKIPNKTGTFKRGNTSPDKVYANFPVFPEFRQTDFTEHSLIAVCVKINNNVSKNVRKINSYSLVKMIKCKDKINEKMDELFNLVQPADDVDKEYNNIEKIILESYKFARVGSAKKPVPSPLARVLKKAKNRLKKNINGNLFLLNITRKLLKKVFRESKKPNNFKPPNTFRDADQQLSAVLSAGRKQDDAGIDSKAKCNEILNSFLVKGEYYPVESVLPDVNNVNKLEMFEKEELEIIFRYLRNGKAAGPSGINNEMLKGSVDLLIPRLLHLFNKVLQTGEVPGKWKRISFYPLKKDATNFRPIALTEVIRKVFERLILARINCKFADQQAGFVRGRSTVDHAIAFDDLLRKGRGNLKAVALDITKAYDSVDRRILYEKLLKNGLNPRLVRIIVGLSENVQCNVKVGDLESDKITMTRGLPQGSVISPVLFNFFINDIVQYIPENDRNKILLYADDVLLIGYSGESLQRLVDCVEEHSKVNCYRFNPKKCIYLSSTQLNITVHGSLIQRNDVLRYLGFYFNSRGIDMFKTVSVARRAAVFKAVVIRKGIRQIYGKYPDPGLVVNFYKAYIRPSLDYSIGICLANAGILKKMEILQKKIVKYLFKWSRRSATKIIYAVLPLEEIELRAKILAQKIFGRFILSNASTLNNLVKYSCTKLIKGLSDNHESLDGENVNFMKKNLINDKKEEVFGPVSHRFNFCRVVDVPLWKLQVQSLLQVSFDLENRDNFINYLEYENKLNIFVDNFENIFKKKY